MFRFKPQRALARAVADLESEAALDWHRSKHPRASFEECAALHMQHFMTETNRQRNGNVSVTVWIMGHTDADTEAYFYLLQIAGKRVTRLEPKSKPR